MSGFQELGGRYMVVSFIALFFSKFEIYNKKYVLFNINGKLLNYKDPDRYLYEIKQTKTKKASF